MAISFEQFVNSIESKLFEGVNVNELKHIQERTLRESSNFHVLLSRLIVLAKKNLASEDINRVLKPLQVLSVGSAYGITFKSGYANINNLLTIKATKPSTSRDASYTIDDSELQREYVIGIALNTLRPLTPCFMYVYDIIRCQTEIQMVGTKFVMGHSNNISFEPYTSNGSPAKICIRNKAVNSRNPLTYYLVTEFISNSMSLESFIIKSSSEDVRVYLPRILLMIFLSLNIASEKLGYVHRDLHGENILIQRLPQEKEFQIHGKSIKTKYLPVIIDYGFSDINNIYNLNSSELYRKNIDFFQRNYPWIQIGETRKLYIFDYYKLTLNVLKALQSSSNHSTDLRELLTTMFNQTYFHVSGENDRRMYISALNTYVNFDYFRYAYNREAPKDFVFHFPNVLFDYVNKTLPLRREVRFEKKETPMDVVHKTVDIEEENRKELQKEMERLRRKEEEKKELERKREEKELNEANQIVISIKERIISLYNDLASYWKYTIDPKYQSILQSFLNANVPPIDSTLSVPTKLKLYRDILDIQEKLYTRAKSVLDNAKFLEAKIPLLRNDIELAKRRIQERLNNIQSNLFMPENLIISEKKQLSKLIRDFEGMISTLQELYSQLLLESSFSKLADIYTRSSKLVEDIAKIESNVQFGYSKIQCLNEGWKYAKAFEEANVYLKNLLAKYPFEPFTNLETNIRLGKQKNKENEELLKAGNILQVKEHNKELEVILIRTRDEINKIQQKLI